MGSLLRPCQNLPQRSCAAHCSYGVRCSPAPIRGAGLSSRTWKTPPTVSTLDPTHQRATKALASVASAMVPGYCTFGTIFEKWQDEMKPASKTVYSWKKIIGKLVAYLRHVPSATEDEMMVWNAASVTEHDVIAWKDSLVAAGLDPTTIKTT
jgi:hypothetical protein